MFLLGIGVWARERAAAGPGSVDRSLQVGSVAPLLPKQGLTLSVIGGTSAGAGAKSSRTAQLRHDG